MDEDGITMTAQDNIPPAIASRVPLEVSDVIGTLPVLESEEPSLYWQMFQNLAVPLEPEDVHEWMLVKTIADCDWQAIRYERIKSRIIDLRFKEALVNILRSILEEETIKHSREQDAQELAEDWFTDPNTKRAILRHLFDYGLSGGSIVAEATRLSMPDLAGLERMAESVERRRCIAHRELEMWREGKRLRRLAKGDVALKALPLIPGKETELSPR
jgi:hypothetical protein